MDQESNRISPNKRWLRSFAPIWVGQLFSLLGSGVVQFALVWYLTNRTGSVVVLTTATFVALLPDVFLAPFAGALVDRWNRKLVMILADGGIALVTLGLAFLFYSNHIQVWHIYAALFLRGIGGNFHWPAMQSSISLMVPEEHLSRVAGINMGLRGGMNIIAPALGALLMGMLPFYGIIAIDVVTAMFAIIPLLFVSVPQPLKKLEEVLTPRQLVKDVVAGYRYISNWKGLLIVVLMATLLNFLLTPTGSLIPLLVTKHFQGGVWQFGAMESASGVGVVVGGLLLGVWGGFRKKMTTVLLGVIGIGAGVMMTGLAPASFFFLALTGVFVTGFMNPITNGPLQAIIQARIEPEMQGRVFTAVSSLASAMSPLGMLAAAPVAQGLGIQSWFILGGAVCIFMGVGAFLVPEIMNLEERGKVLLAQPAE